MPLFKGVCYPNDAEAKKAACSASSTSWGDGSSLYTVECTDTEFSAAYMTMCKRVDGGSCLVSQQPYPAFPPCDFDGGVSLTLDWLYLVLPLAATLYGLKKLLGLFDSTDRD